MRSLALLVLLLIAAPAMADDPKPDVPLLTVSGEGEARAAPDVATVRLGVVIQDREASAAQAGANKVARALLEKVRALQVAARDVQSSEVTLTPVFGGIRPGQEGIPPPIVAYRASNTISVRLEDLSLIGKVIDAGVAAGVNNIQGVEFGVRNETPLRAQALRDAVAEARRKAEAIADALGVELRGVHDVEEGGARIIPPPARFGGMMAAEGQATPVEPGQVAIHGTVTIRYVIANRPH